MFNRRRFLDALLAVGFVSTAAAIAYPVVAVPHSAGERRTGDGERGRRPRRRRSSPTPRAIFKFGSQPGIVVRTADGDVRAFSAVCTHLDCTVQFKTDTSQLWCACHNGIYDLGGNVVSGPPPRGLEKFVVNLRGERRRERSSCRAAEHDDASVVAWLDERLDLSGIRHFIAEKGVPVHTQKVWYYLGGMTLFLFGVQVFTGILLLLYYRPSAAEAYESVQFIVTQVQFGWLIRNVHSWSANLLIALAFAHFFSVFFLKSYRKPRELTWLTGILLLFLMLGFGFSGYLLPWNELSFFATKVGTGIAGAVPLIGPFTLRLLRGGDDVTGATLSRFYGLHVAILPAITTALVAAHLLLVQRQGMSVPLSVERQLKPGERLPQMPFFPNYILRDVLAWYVVLAVLAALAAFYPWELGHEGGPVRRRAAGHPARVVLPGDVPHAEAAAEPRARHRRRAPRRRGVRSRRGVSRARAVPRSAREPRRAEPGVHGAGGARPRVSRVVHHHRALREVGATSRHAA